MMILTSVLLFLLAGLLEIGGGYLVWIWLRGDQPMWVGLLGFLLLASYGIIPTLQPAHFGRVYAAYGGVFIVLSMAWGWRIDGIAPDRFDLIGSSLALAGVFLMMYAPRG
jgi:small multidrug resistance family-3 protein